MILDVDRSVYLGEFTFSSS
uniref:Uncharacterized protein n=1 Tax=Rhizophora mucronata TaxID=61149 RepID=A0A2P2R556_RHIMU